MELQPTFMQLLAVITIALQLFLESNILLFFDTTIEVRLVQPEEKSSTFNLVTLSGIVMEVRLLQLQKVPPPIDVTVSGIVIDLNDVQP